jgi:hypothetical protein
MADVTIEVRPNGPYIINGSIELRDANGNVLPTSDQDRPLSLWRIDEQAVLRRDTLKGWLSGCRTRGA